MDDIVPAGSGIQTENVSGGENGRPELGDKVIYTFTERIEPESIVAGWTGASTNVTVRIVDTAPTTRFRSGTTSMGRSCLWA
ncbi:MAG TPA: hypothetical protein VE915_04470 [Actinomycetota bacterium]|nr:hypothetical protein [Actinomycetota bacterium]